MKKDFTLKRINNIKLKTKLSLIYLITGLIPIIILFSVSYYQMKDILLKSDNDSVENFLQQSISSVDSKLEIYDNLSNYISFNETISRIVSYDYKSNYERYEQLVQTFDPMVSSLKYFHDDVKKVTIYTESDIKHDTTIAPISEISSKSWFKSASGDTKIQWIADSKNNSLISVRSMPLLFSEGVLGIMYIDVDYNNVFSAFSENLAGNYGVIIVDNNNAPVYEYSNFDGAYEDIALSSEDMVSMAANGKWDNDVFNDVGIYSVIRKKSNAAGWTAYMYEPKSYVISSAKPMAMMIIVATMVAVLGAVIALLFTSKFITNRLKKLERSMHEVEQGNFELKIESTDKDEIGELINGFGSMIEQINTLIKEVYQAKISQKEYEMRALRAQINPHFLYNSLSLINWKAIEYNQRDISEITLALSNYYRTSLNKGKNTLTVEMELTNMKSYLDIQQVMHDNSFDVVVDVDEEILQYETLNLILQPLIENAIDHGIDLKTDGRGVIEIRGKMIYRDIPLICITVKDNGVGIDEDGIKEILSVNSKGYGARNVNERIKLYYGEQYNLKIESEINKGTMVTIIFPARKM